NGNCSFVTFLFKAIRLEVSLLLLGLSDLRDDANRLARAVNPSVGDSNLDMARLDTCRKRHQQEVARDVGRVAHPNRVDLAILLKLHCNKSRIIVDPRCKNGNISTVRIEALNRQSALIESSFII